MSEIISDKKSGSNGVQGSDSKKNKKAKKNPVISFFKAFFIFILILIVLISGILCFCVFDRKQSLAAIPRNYTAYIHTDSAFHSVNPLLDLQATDILLSTPEYLHLRKAFITLRGSNYRDNKFVQFLLSRSVDLAIYNGIKNTNYVAVLNLGIFSAATRISEFAAERFSIPDLSYMSCEQMKYFLYEKDGLRVFIKPVKNLLIASDSLELLLTASLAENDTLYTNEQKKFLSENYGKSLRIIANGQQLVDEFTGSDEFLHSFTGLISSESMSVIDLNVTDSDISVKCQIPIEEDTSDSLGAILKKNSKTPSCLSRLSDSVQYYTILNAGTLPELKESLFPFFSRKKNIDRTWISADNLCKTTLGISLEDLIFSWTGKEFLAFGLENHNDPVFALQVKDEKQRKKIFDLVKDSLFVKEDDSLILDGVRLPKLKLPDYLNWILSAFNISVPSPYFLVEDGFVYFSQSPESLSQIYSDRKSGNSLVKSANWQQVSSGQKADSCVSLYYDLEKSAPFFLRSSQAVSSVLRLYTQGRFDVRTKNSVVEFHLQARARKAGSLISVPGFPVQIDKTADAENFFVLPDSKIVCWVENKNTIKTMDLSDRSVHESVLNDEIFISPSPSVNKGGVVWAVTTYGEVNLMNEKLENVSDFPVMLGSHVSASPSSSENGLYIPLEDEKIAFVDMKGKVTFIEIPELYVKAPVSVLDDFAAVYNKGFLGKIYNFERNSCINLGNPIEIDEIGLGSPAISKNGSKYTTAFISQSGLVRAWNNGKELKNFPVQLEGVYLINLQASEKYLYALSEDAVLTRIGMGDGKTLSVRIPKSTARNAYLSVKKNPSGNYSVFVNADSNVIYGFNEKLELISGYPLTGSGIPYFVDLNGSKSAECVALTVDKKIVAWKVR